VVSAGGGRRRKAEDGEPVTTAEGTTDGGDGGEDLPAKPLLGEADPELERLLAEEEEIERRTREHHETPHFRGGEE
jgi:small subunit ribosomal protein S3